MKYLLSVISSLLIVLSSSADASDRLMQLVLNAPDDSYVIQLASYPENTDLDKALQQLKFHKRLVAVSTLVKGKRHWVLLEGIYQNKKEADKSAKLIRLKHPKIKPWIRKMANFKKVLSVNKDLKG